jgi:hypothetical protein
MDEEAFQEMARKRIVYHLPGMEDVPVRSDIVFKTAGDLALNMDLYSPGEQAPIILPVCIVSIRSMTMIARVRLFAPLLNLSGRIYYRIAEYYVR